MKYLVIILNDSLKSSEDNLLASQLAKKGACLTLDSFHSEELTKGLDLALKSLLKCGLQNVSEEDTSAASRAMEHQSRPEPSRGGLSACVPKGAENLAGVVRHEDGVEQHGVAVESVGTKVREGSSLATAVGAGGLHTGSNDTGEGGVERYSGAAQRGSQRCKGLKNQSAEAKKASVSTVEGLGKCDPSTTTLRNSSASQARTSLCARRRRVAQAAPEEQSAAARAAGSRYTDIGPGSFPGRCFNCGGATP